MLSEKIIAEAPGFLVEQNLTEFTAFSAISMGLLEFYKKKYTVNSHPFRKNEMLKHFRFLHSTDAHIQIGKLIKTVNKFI